MIVERRVLIGALALLWADAIYTLGAAFFAGRVPVESAPWLLLAPIFGAPFALVAGIAALICRRLPLGASCLLLALLLALSYLAIAASGWDGLEGRM